MYENWGRKREDGTRVKFWSSFSRYIQFQIGDGTRVKFWHDVWCGDNPLSMCFLDLFRISNDKEVYVTDLMQFSNGVLF